MTTPQPDAGGYAWTEWLAAAMEADTPAEPAAPPAPQEERR